MDRAALLLLIVSLAGCSSKPRIVVGSKNFTEQVILGELIAAQIERKLGIEVDRKFNLGGTLLAHEALTSGSIDLYPEYTGTALTAVLKQAPDNDAKRTFAKVQQGYTGWHLTWLAPFGFNDSFAMVVRADTARTEQLRTLSDSAKRPWKLGVGYEFTERPDGLNGLVKTYNLKMDGEPVAMDLGLLYPALQSEKVDMAAANSTDGRLADPQFAILQDDRHYFPPYECAIVVREQTLSKVPALRAVLEELSGHISDDAMRRMNQLVDVEHRGPAAVAHDFLSSLK